MRWLGAVAESWKVWGKNAKVASKPHGRGHHIKAGGPQPVDQDDRRTPNRALIRRLTTENDLAVNGCPGMHQCEGQGSTLTVSFAGRRRDGRVVDGGGLENH